MIKKLQQGQKVLILRYGKQIVNNCIELHQKKIEQQGYCWFGKLGTVPSKKSMDMMLDEEKPALILYARGSAFLCSVSEVVYDRPKEGCPDYYQTELFDNLTFPAVYFKLHSIDEIDVNELVDFVVISSGNDAISTLMHSMSSFIFVSYGKVIKNKPEKNIREKTQKREQLPGNDCVYRKDGRCSLKNFVNYQYDCEKPSNCIKQKR